MTIEAAISQLPKALKAALNRRSPRVAANLRRLGKPISDRAVRKLAETSADVPRRNAVEQTLLLMGAIFLTSPRAFEALWQFFEGFRAALYGRMPEMSLDRAFAEFRYWTGKAEVHWFRGEIEEVRKALIQVDQALRPVWWRLQTID